MCDEEPLTVAEAVTLTTAGPVSRVVAVAERSSAPPRADGGGLDRARDVPQGVAAAGEVHSAS